MNTYLTEYAHFTRKHDLDAAAKQHVLAHWNYMNYTERAVLDMIRRYSFKYETAHLKHETIEKVIKKSTATVRRAIRKLEHLDIIERIHYIRPDISGLGANISFNDQSKMNSPEESEKPSDSKPQPQNSESEALLSKAINSKDFKRTSPTKVLPTTLFSKMNSLLSSTIENSKLACNFYGVYRSQSLQMLKFSIHEDKVDLLEHLAMQALRISIQTTKLKKYGIFLTIIQVSCANSSARHYLATLLWIMMYQLRGFSIYRKKSCGCLFEKKQAILHTIE